jgi:UDP-3-O-[3-hydroxymyristoyl] glucosamine N-acyltransferase
MPTVPLGEIADFVGGHYLGDRNRRVAAVAPLAEAREGHLSFLRSRKYAAQLVETKAGAILVPQHLEGEDERWIRVEDPHFAIARITTRWFSARPMPKGVSPKALIALTAKLGANVAVGPFVTIGDGVVKSAARGHSLRAVQV